MAFKSSSVINLVYSYKANQTRFECSLLFKYFSDPTNVGCVFAISLPLSADSAKINIISTNGKQDVLKQPEANTDLLYFSALSYYKSSVETNFPIIVLTCPYNKSSAEIMRACKITQITMMRGV